jgi:hypothetical protein
MQHLLQVKGQRGGWHIELFGDLACRDTFRSALHQQPVRREAVIVGDGAKRRDNLFCVHNRDLSINIKIWSRLPFVNDISSIVEMMFKSRVMSASGDAGPGSTRARWRSPSRACVSAFGDDPLRKRRRGPEEKG